MSTTPDNTAPAEAGAASEPAAPAATSPEASPVAAAPAPAEAAADHDDGADDGDDGEDEGAQGPEGPAGPTAEGEGPKKKKRRRKKKKAGGPVGPEGPAGPAGPEGPAPAHVEGGGGKGPRREGGRDKGGPARERAAFQIGEEVFGKVTSVLEHAIMVDLAGKALAIFDRSELANDDLLPAPGDRFNAQVIGDGSRGGLVVLTRKPLREEEAKPQVEQAFKDQSTVLALVTGVIKGGLEVYADGLRAFAPASHVDLRLGADLTHLIGQRMPFLVEQYAKRGRDVVLSRKMILEEEHKNQRSESLAKLVVGNVYPGVVRTVVQWGIFVAIPEADDVEGLIHLTEISHDPRARVFDAAKVGDQLPVKVVKIDEKGKLWLSKKQAEADPWEEIRNKYAVGTRHVGKITRMQPFGAFVELEPGLDGLIHVGDLSLRRIEKPEDVVKLGQEITVVVARMDAATRKIGLHPAPPEDEAELKQKVAPHKSVKVAIVAHETGGLLVRVLGQTGSHARGFIPAGQTGTPRGTDLRKSFPMNSVHEAKIIEIDPRRGECKLTIKGLKEDGEKQAYNDYRKTVLKEAKFGTFADLLKPKGLGKAATGHGLERVQQLRTRIEAGRPFDANTGLFAEDFRVDVEIVERLDVIGEKADGRDQHVANAGLLEFAKRRLEIGPEPVAAVHALTLERDARRAGFGASGVNRVGHRAKLALVGVARGDDPRGQAVRREHQRCGRATLFRKPCEALVDRLVEGREQRRLEAPRRCFEQLDAGCRGRRARGLVIDGDALWGERQREQPRHPARRCLGDRRLDRRVPEPHPDDDRDA
jgi:small subunit ribosomal protein S1